MPGADQGRLELLPSDPVHLSPFQHPDVPGAEVEFAQFGAAVGEQVD